MPTAALAALSIWKDLSHYTARVSGFADALRFAAPARNESRGSHWSLIVDDDEEQVRLVPQARGTADK